MRISQKVFWIFFTIISVTLVLAANQIFTYFTQQQLNDSIYLINRLQNQVRQLDKVQLTLMQPDKEFDRSLYDRLVEQVSRTSQELTVVMADLPAGIRQHLANMTFNLDNFRTSLLELAETRTLSAELEAAIHASLSKIHEHDQADSSHQLEHAEGEYHHHSHDSGPRTLADLQLHFQAWAFVHDKEFDRLPNIKKTIQVLIDIGQNLSSAKELEQLSLHLESFYQSHLRLNDRKQFVELSANNFLEATQFLLLELEERSIKQQRKVSQLSLLISFLGLLAAVFFWYRIRVYLRRFLFNQKQVMQAIQTGSNNLQLVPQSKDELGDLTSAMKELSVELVKKKADLQQSEQKYRSLIENLTDWVWETDARNSFSFCSEASENITGYQNTEILGRRYLTLSIDCEDMEVIEHFESHFSERRAFTNIERKVLCKDGSIKHLICSATPLFDPVGKFLGFRGVERDVSRLVLAREEQEQLESKLQHSQKMESIGRLAGGVAHDFNNILSAIIGYSDLIMRRLEPEHKCFRYVKEINKSGERAAGLTRQLLAFSRKQSRSPESLDLQKELVSLEGMLHRLVGERVDVDLQIADDVWPVLMDKSQLEQVVVNLVVNAKDAMSGEGKISISAINCPPDCSCRDRENVNLPPESFVQLTVADNGCGMSEELIQEIFDPFFTTKDRDKGTGLGLAMVYGIITQNNGEINVSSEIGRGSRFNILIPRSLENVETQEEADDERPLRTGTETILFAEDEASLTKMHSEFLESLGYRVVTAADGAEALEVFKKEEEIDLLITDVVMPNMDGVELVDELRKLTPELKVIFTSGYTHHEYFEKGILEEGVNFIFKPATPIDMAKMIEQYLD